VKSLAYSIFLLVIVIAIFVMLVFFVRPLLLKYQGLLFNSSRPDIFGITLVIALLLVSSAITDVLGVHAVLGAFIARLIMSAEIKIKSPVKMKAARVASIGWRDSFVLGVLMNTRGLMELIALNIGYDLGVISKPVFTLLVLMAILTPFMTGPILNLILDKNDSGSAMSHQL
jgi:Kef-type K+ transport system membrane component KefB